MKISESQWKHIVRPFKWYTKLSSANQKLKEEMFEEYFDNIESVVRSVGRTIPGKSSLLRELHDISGIQWPNRPPVDSSQYYPADFPMSLWPLRLINTAVFSLYSLLTQEFIEILATSPYIKGKRVLEVFAGSGILSLGLEFHGIDVHPTDDLTWFGKGGPRYPHCVLVNDVEELDALEAVKKYGSEYDVLLMSWPPIDDSITIEACREWNRIHTSGLIVYIGEPEGGATGCQEIYDEYKILDVIPMCNYDCIHDNVMILSKKYSS